MRALMVTIKIKAGHRDAFVEALLSDARGSVYDEPGCLRFDVLLTGQGRSLPCLPGTWKCQVASCMSYGCLS